jgi:hypothetical protein
MVREDLVEVSDDDDINPPLPFGPGDIEDVDDE